MKKWKSAAAGLMAVLLCTVLCLSASAKEWDGEDFTFDVPEEFVYTFTSATPAEDPSWALAGIANASTNLQDYKEMNILADFYTEDGESGPNIKVQQKTNSSTKRVFNLRDLSEEERAEFLDNIIQSRTEEIRLEKSYVDVAGQPFCRIKIDGKTEEGEAHEIQYNTIFNGHSLAFIMYGREKELPPEWLSLLESAVMSLRVTQLLEKPEVQPASAIPVLLLLLLMVVILVAPVVYLPLRKRKEKKLKARIGAQMESFRKAHGEGVLLGEPLFVNETDCTREAIHSFSLYHAYIKNLPSLLLGGALCAAALVLAFLFDLTWWLKALAVGITVYYAYRVISMPGTVEKVQRKVFSRGVSSTARYSFFEDGFRVSGIQSANVFPYFQITDVRRNGHYLYLYYGPDNAYPVDQFGFSLGESEAFEGFIREKAKKGA